MDPAPTQVTLAIPRFHVVPMGENAHDFCDVFRGAMLVTLDASGVRTAQQSLGAMLASADASLYIVVEADEPFVPGDVPTLIQEVRSGAALVVRGVVWRASDPVRSNPRLSRNRLALWIVDRVLGHRRHDVLSGLFVIQRSGQAAKGGS